MNWRMILLLADLGLIIGALSVFGYTLGFIEPLLWLIAAVISALVIARLQKTRRFTHGIWTGLLASMFAAVIKMMFFEIYLLHYPMSGETPVDPRLFMLLASIPIGLVYGAVIGGLTLLAQRFISAPQPP